MSEWKKVTYNKPLEICRTGWPGAYDAFVSALLHRPRVTTLIDYEFSINVLTDQEVKLDISDNKEFIDNPTFTNDGWARK